MKSIGSSHSKPAGEMASMSRRECLQWSARLAMGVMLPAAGLGLASCGGDGGTADTLPEPPLLRSRGGRLDLELRLAYARQQLPYPLVLDTPAYPAPSSVRHVHLRSYNGRYLAPTVLLDSGDMLRVRLINALPDNVPNESSLPYLNHQNSTNLHFHGLHVDPKEIRPGVFGDYVVDNADAGVLPGQHRNHEIQLPANHPDGIYWYHPHLHGATNSQVLSGLFGAILIRDPSNEFTADPEIEDRCIFVHKLVLNDEGRVDSFYDSLITRRSAFLLNGAAQPTIVMRPGQVQRWHFINATMFWPFTPVLDGHVMQAYARDGNNLDRKFLPVHAQSGPNTPGVTWPGTAIYPGNRLSVVVQADSQPGTYFLRSIQSPFGDQEEIVAKLVVEGSPRRMSFPSASLLGGHSVGVPITDEELARHGGHQRHLMLSVESPDSELLPATSDIDRKEWFIPESDAAEIDKNFVFAAGRAGGPIVPFQSSLTETQTVPLNAVEEWTIYNGNNYPHPFHIHVNECYVVRINGEPVEPYWADTLALPRKGSVTFRSRFTDFTGAFVWHCHALNHEDMGMMQIVEVV